MSRSSPESLLLRFYYRLKPLIPYPLRLKVRGLLARRQRARWKEYWPILEVAGQQPANWPGWPERREFAFVLTHDVEGSIGLEQCRALAALEEELGFRSCFNFVPEGEYRVPAELRESLVSRGFEVGIHGLHHDGLLYESLEVFRSRANRINQYAKEWGTVGFRSPFMHHNLDWLQQLDMEYDGSTFDVDPFEPQSDGSETIFPFWVERPGGGGFVELPYTLVQDSTLFLLLKEADDRVWRDKLAWVAARGGMALVNVHPDYMSLGERKRPRRTYDPGIYAAFLRHVREHYSGRCWHALPREVARYARGFTPRNPAQTRKRICMITHSFYESDNRVMRYAEALAGRGDEVEVLSLMKSVRQPETEMLSGVKAIRLQRRERKNEQARGAYLLPILRFFLRSSLMVCRRHWQRPYDLLHVHNVPDFLVFAGWLPRLTGAGVILDIHDIVPEFYASKFQTKSDALAVRVLCWIERWSAAFAHHVIISNHLWLEKYTARSAAPAKCSVFINHVDEAVFQRYPRHRQDGKFVLIFPGGLQWHQGLDIAIRAFERVSASLPEAEFQIYGDGNVREALVALTKELKVDDRVRFFDPLPLRQIAEVMANADLGVVPKRADSFGNEAYSTKIMEFMALGVPVVISRTKIDSYYFNERVARFFPSGDADALAEAILDLARHPDERNRMVEAASEYAHAHSWQQKRGEYLSLVDGLCQTARARR
jgi:glycosyltransferase involved in cell wall biosynthesis/peptidoglycan/xylan/chitin deacetylase (PgdA/CDA1 family)